MTIWRRLKTVCAVLIWRIEYTINDELAMARGKIDRIRFAAIILGVPMAIIDEINALDGIITNRLATVGADAAALVTANQAVTDLTDQVTAANAHATELQGQLDTATAAIQALEAKYQTPA